MAAIPGGNMSRTGGFWSLCTLQTPGAPLLTIHLLSTISVLISWPSSASGFVLQQNSPLHSSAWEEAPQIINDNGTTQFIIFNPPPGNHCYRLFKAV